MKIFDEQLLSRLSAEAVLAPRRRKNLNIHPSDDFCCHRLFNAIEPGSYIRPHRHQDTSKDETFVIISGRLGVLMFDDDGTVVESAVLSAHGSVRAVDIPHGRFHSAVALETGTIFFESKAGPYLPLAMDEIAPWSPAEGTPESLEYLKTLTECLRG